MTDEKKARLLLARAGRAGGHVQVLTAAEVKEAAELHDKHPEPCEELGAAFKVFWEAHRERLADDKATTEETDDLIEEPTWDSSSTSLSE